MATTARMRELRRSTARKDSGKEGVILIEAPLIIATFSGILKFLSWVHGESRLHDQKMREALNAIHDAALETRGYQAVWKTKRDLNKEIELSKKWAKAAAKMAECDTRWSKIAKLKDDYWSDPDKWTDQQIEDAGIDLKEVTSKVEDLLGIPSVS